MFIILEPVKTRDSTYVKNMQQDALDLFLDFIEYFASDSFKNAFKFLVCFFKINNNKLFFMI